MIHLVSNRYHYRISPHRHYLTANSCVHEGYSEYDWPAGWMTGVKGLNLCGKAGEGAEQFRYVINSLHQRLNTSLSPFSQSHFNMILHNRNCAEVRISPSGMAPPADEDGTNDEADERPAPGSSDGDKPSVSPIGMASPADEDGTNEEADERPVPGKIDGDKPSGKTKPEKMEVNYQEE